MYIILIRRILLFKGIKSLFVLMLKIIEHKYFYGMNNKINVQKIYIFNILIYGLKYNLQHIISLQKKTHKSYIKIFIYNTIL